MKDIDLETVVEDDYDLSLGILDDESPIEEGKVKEFSLEAVVEDDYNLSSGVLDAESSYQSEVEDEDLMNVIKKQNDIINKSNDSMQKMQDSITKIAEAQTEIMSKNADSLQVMQESMSSTIIAQSKLVDSFSKAIETKYSNQEKIGMSDDIVVDAKVIEKKKSRWYIKYIVLIAILACLGGITSVREKIKTVALDIKEIAVDTASGNDVSFDKLLKDLGSD